MNQQTKTIVLAVLISVLVAVPITLGLSKLQGKSQKSSANYDFSAGEIKQYKFDNLFKLAIDQFNSKDENSAAEFEYSFNNLVDEVNLSLGSIKGDLKPLSRIGGGGGSCSQVYSNLQNIYANIQWVQSQLDRYNELLGQAYSQPNPNMQYIQSLMQTINHYLQVRANLNEIYRSQYAYYAANCEGGQGN